MEVWLESVAERYEQLDELLKDYFAKTIAKEGLPPLRMNWPAYIMLNDRNDLLLFCARGIDDGNLLGFVMYHIHPHLHHVGVINAACDILAVRVDARGRGVARTLMYEAEPVLRDHGVQYITHQFRTCYDVEPLFPKLGYKLIEQGYVKKVN
jgi:GNAT superfamily N-acetyltransferase